MGVAGGGMTAQLGLDFGRAERARDEALGRVERVVSSDFLARAANHVLETLVLRGPSSGEVLVSLCEHAGIRSTDSRHFGSVLRRLSGRGLIACTGYCERAKGHRTAGGRIWSVTAAGRAEVGA
jgi:hypothetical protein